MTAYQTWSKVKLDVAPRFSVVIPTYNEAIRILPTVGAIASELCDLGEPWELIVSDDGSTDATVQILKDLELANLTIIESANTGKGGAVRRGMLAARGRYLLFADADQSTPIEQFSLMVAAIDAGADVAVGSRLHAQSRVQSRSPLRALISGGLHLLVKTGFRISVGDTQCGFKMFTADAAHRLFAIQRIDGFSFDFEVLWLATRAGMSITEVPVLWVDAPGSKVEPVRDSIRFLTDLGRVRWWSLLGRYHLTGPPTGTPAGTLAGTATSQSRRNNSDPNPVKLKEYS